MYIQLRAFLDIRQRLQQLSAGITSKPIKDKLMIIEAGVRDLAIEFEKEQAQVKK
jgi:hypothetical protein